MRYLNLIFRHLFVLFALLSWVYFFPRWTTKVFLLPEDYAWTIMGETIFSYNFIPFISATFSNKGRDLGLSILFWAGWFGIYLIGMKLIINRKSAF